MQMSDLSKSQRAALYGDVAAWPEVMECGMVAERCEPMRKVRGKRSLVRFWPYVIQWAHGWSVTQPRHNHSAPRGRADVPWSVCHGTAKFPLDPGVTFANLRLWAADLTDSDMHVVFSRAWWKDNAADFFKRNAQPRAILCEYRKPVRAVGLSPELIDHWQRAQNGVIGGVYPL